MKMEALRKHFTRLGLANVETFAAAHGYRVRRLTYDGPEDLSPLVADLYRWRLRDHGLPSGRLC